MTETEKKTSADDLVKEALASVEKLEQSRAADPETLTDEIDLDSISVLKADGSEQSLRSAEAAAVSMNENDESMDENGEEELFVADDAASSGNPILEAMIFAKNEAVEALEQTQKEAKTFRERLQRVSADFENYKKRQSRERKDAALFANESLLKELMPVLDNMERAVTAADVAVQENAENAAGNLLEGTQMVLKLFQDTLVKFGIQPFSAAGQKFDPAVHEAVGAREDSSVPNQTVIEEYQRGYMLHGRLARPAMVVVSSGGSDEKKASVAEDVDSKTATEPEANDS